MSKVTEVELRGPVKHSDVGTLKGKLEGKGVLKETKNRILIDYTTFLEGETVEGRTKDIRIRNTNGTSEIIIKTGKWGGSDVRDEFKVQTNGSFDSLVKVMDLLGYTKGVLCVRNSEVYQLEEVEISLVEVPGHSYYFEAEIETEDSVESEALRSKIETIVSELGLNTFSDNEFYAYIKRLNEEANTVFDSTVESADFFHTNFKI